MIVDWLVCESGLIWLKVGFEVKVNVKVLYEVVVLFLCSIGEVLLFELGWLNLVCCCLFGVVGVIVLFNFLLYLVMCVVVLVFVLGNVVVFKFDLCMVVCGGFVIVWLFELVGLLVGLLYVLFGDGVVGVVLICDFNIVMI